jgi:hypothetical protein
VFEMFDILTIVLICKLLEFLFNPLNLKYSPLFSKEDSSISVDELYSVCDVLLEKFSRIICDSINLWGYIVT